MTDDTTTARLDTTDPDRPRGDVGLGDARREALAEALDRFYGEADYLPTFEQAADALAPLIAGWLGEERAGALREFADRWGRWVVDDAPQVRGGAAYRARAEADRIARGDA